MAHYIYEWLSQTETWVHGQVTHLPSPIEPYVITQRTKNLDQFAFPRIHAFEDEPAWRRWTDLLLRKIGVRDHLAFVRDRLVDEGALLLHSHFGPAGYENAGAAEAAGIPHVVTFYGMDVNQLPTEEPVWRDRYREMFDRVDLVFCEGPAMREQVLDLGCPPEIAEVHHLGIEVDRFRFEPRTWTPGEPLRVLFASTFTEKKGIPYGLEALARLTDRVDLEITLVGDAGSSERSQREKQRILDTIEENDLEPHVDLVGYVSYEELIDLAYDHHVFMAPSVHASDGDNEGGAPVTIIEMAATGMPIVASRHCDIPEIVKHEETGLLADERDVDGLTSALEWLIEHPDRWKELAEAARAHVEEDYDAATQGRRLADRYRTLVDEA